MTDTPMNPMNQAMNPTEPLKPNTKPMKPNTNGMLRLFVHGTLKRGFWNHDRFCRGVLTVENAVVSGPPLREALRNPDPAGPGGGYPRRRDHQSTRRRGHTSARRGLHVQSRANPRPASEEGHRRALGPRVRGDSHLRRSRKPAFWPSTGWRGSAPAVPTSTDASWYPSGQTEPFSRPGFTWWGIAGSEASRS